jgi:hypothetical protein
MNPHNKWDDYDITFTITMTIKQRRLKCIECMNKGDELYDVPICYTKFLKYDPSWHWIKVICYVQLKSNPIGVKVQDAFNVVDYYFTANLIATSNYCGKNYVAKASQNWKHKAWLMNRYNDSPLQWDELHLKAWSWLKGEPLQGHVQFGVEYGLM